MHNTYSPAFNSRNFIYRFEQIIDQLAYFHRQRVDHFHIFFLGIRPICIILQCI